MLGETAAGTADMLGAFRQRRRGLRALLIGTHVRQPVQFRELLRLFAIGRICLGPDWVGGRLTASGDRKRTADAQTYGAKVSR